MKAFYAKRSFIRPLLFWVGGVGLQLNCPEIPWALLLSAMVLLLLIGSGWCRQDGFHAGDLFSWGYAFALLLMASAAFVTTVSARYQPDVSRETLLDHPLRSQLLARADQLRLTQEERSVLVAMTLGERRQMPRETRRSFALSGVSHVLAVSGFHVAIVCGLVVACLRHFNQWRWRWLTLFIILASLWGYLLLSGLAPSAVRAGIMLSFVLFTRYRWQNYDSYNSLAATAFCMLVFNPYYLLDIGFQLSFVAVFFILWLQPLFLYWLPIRSRLLAFPCHSLCIALAAQLGTAGLTLYHFGRFSWLFLFTNLPVTLFSLLLVPLGLIWLLWPSTWWGSSLLQEGVELLTRGMCTCVTRFSQVPGADWEVSFGGVALVLYYVVVVFICHQLLQKVKVKGNKN